MMATDTTVTAPAPPARKQPAQVQAPAIIAPTVETPKFQGGCKTGSYEATMKMADGSNMKYCVMGK